MRMQIAYSIFISTMCTYHIISYHIIWYYIISYHIILYYIILYFFALTHLLPFHVPWPGKRGKHPSSSKFCAKLQCFQQLGRVSGLPQLKDVKIVRGHELFKRWKISRYPEHSRTIIISWWNFDTRLKMFMLLVLLSNFPNMDFA